MRSAASQTSTASPISTASLVGTPKSVVRDGLVRAIDDAEQANAIGGDTANVLRGIATRLPIGLVLAVLRGASGLLPS